MTDDTATIARLDLVGTREIATRLGVSKATVNDWRYRDRGFPSEDLTVSGVPAWRWSIIEEWAKATGRVKS